MQHWPDTIAAEEGAGMPAKRFMFPPHSFLANYCLPEGGAKAAAKGERK